MSQLIGVLLTSLWATSVVAADIEPSTDNNVVETIQVTAPDSAQLESELQHLPWEQFRWVVESVPKLKANVEAYGPAGWNYIKKRYQTYAWRKSIDKLDADQKQLLANLLKRTRSAQ